MALHVLSLGKECCHFFFNQKMGENRDTVILNYFLSVALHFYIFSFLKLECNY